LIEIYIDGDACPVKSEIIKVAERHNLKINVASNGWLRFGETSVEINQVMLPKTPDAADNWIAENIKKNDIAVTNDIPLASRCLNAGAIALRPNGSEFTSDNIGTSLGMRDFNSFLREIGEKGGVNPPFSQKDRSNFLNSFENIIQKALRKPS
jgi:uncharacterized protein YaiI (UPF0178 family)